MQQLEIYFQNTKEVSQFVNLINTYDGDFDLISGRFVVDAKSILGVLSIGLQKPILLQIHNDTFDTKKLKNFSKNSYKNFCCIYN